MIWIIVFTILIIGCLYDSLKNCILVAFGCYKHSKIIIGM